MKMQGINESALSESSTIGERRVVGELGSQPVTVQDDVSKNSSAAEARGKAYATSRAACHQQE